MLEIHNLEVRFDVEGDDDEVFSRLFAAHIRRWSRLQEAERCRAGTLAQERQLGDSDRGTEDML